MAIRSLNWAARQSVSVDQLHVVIEATGVYHERAAQTLVDADVTVSIVKSLYERLLARGKIKMAALGAAMRKRVQLCFGVIKTRTPFMRFPRDGQDGIYAATTRKDSAAPFRPTRLSVFRRSGFAREPGTAG